MFDDELVGQIHRTLARPAGEIVSPPWETAHGVVGFDFPQDYRWFIGEYGFGTINDYMHVFGISEKLGRGGLSGFAELVSWSQDIYSCGDGDH